jgi:hypothetical protein
MGKRYSLLDADTQLDGFKFFAIGLAVSGSLIIGFIVLANLLEAWGLV